MRPRLAGIAVLLAALVAVAAGWATGASERTSYDPVTLRHAPSGFSIQAPPGFSIRLSKGVYVLEKGRVSVSFSRLVTSVAPAQLGAALTQQLGGTVVVRAGDAKHFVTQLTRGARRDAFVVERIGSKLVVTTSAASNTAPVALETLKSMGRSARGGVSLRAPNATPQASIKLVPYRTVDGGATALVPAGSEWTIGGTQGRIEGSGPKGLFLFGFSINVPTPAFAPPGTPPSIFVSDTLSAVAALQRLLPHYAPAISNVRIRKVLKDAVLPSFTSSGLLLFDYRLNGKPWRGVATVGTDSSAKVGGSVWQFYYSGIGVPVNSNPAVGVGLLRSWKSWDPSGAIAARTRAAIAILNETNEVWQQTSEFRSQTADRQSRDVGCLLQGYYLIEDNSRKYNLPPLPCGQIYTERG